MLNKAKHKNQTDSKQKAKHTSYVKTKTQRERRK